MPDFRDSVFSFPAEVFRVAARALNSWSIQQPSLPCWRLWWNSEPGASVTWNDRRFKLTPDHIVLVAPETAFKVVLSRPVECHLFIHFALGSTRWRLTDRVISLAPPDETLKAALALSKRLLQTRDKTLTEPLRAISLVSSVLDLTDEEMWPAPPTDHRVRRVVTAIDGNPGAHWPDAALARLASMSAGGFARLFRAQNGGLSPQAYLHRQRLALARHLLMQTELPIESVAEQSGFCDRSYFSTVFRREVGVPPAKYRQQTR
jgi:AraC-like DNA-binding protein